MSTKRPSPSRTSNIFGSEARKGLGQFMTGAFFSIKWGTNSSQKERHCAYGWSEFQEAIVLEKTGPSWSGSQN